MSLSRDGLVNRTTFGKRPLHQGVISYSLGEDSSLSPPQVNCGSKILLEIELLRSAVLGESPIRPDPGSRRHAGKPEAAAFWPGSGRGLPSQRAVASRSDHLPQRPVFAL